MNADKELRKEFHISAARSDALYKDRLASQDTVVLDINIGDHPAFYCMNAEVYKLILQTERLDKEIRALMGVLPPIAVEQYMKSSLIDEIVLTNEIEGVNSSRREIGEVLEGLKKRDKRGRFQGIVEKYVALSKRKDIPLNSCGDIRSICDDLVLDEVASQKPSNAPDGEIFRANEVSVLDASGQPIHQGIMPEARIIEYLDHALAVLNDQSTELLVRISVFHFLFGYIHPFYDGHGRTNRFISSYLMAHDFCPIVGLRLSHAVKQDIQKYYKAYSVCEHQLNRGDLTPFVIRFSQIVVDAMKSMLDSLSERALLLEQANAKLSAIPGVNEEKGRLAIGNVLIQAALFADLGIPMDELTGAVRMSSPTVHKRLAFYEKQGLLTKRRQGHRMYYSMDLARI